MIQYSETKNSNLIEEVVCKPFSKLVLYPMDEETTRIMMQLLLAKDGDKIILKDEEKPFLFKLIESRIKGCFTFEIIEHRLIFFLAVISKSPGTAIMYLWYLQYWCFKNNVKTLTFSIFCERIFAHGFPNEIDLHKIWDSQKVKLERGDSDGDNLVDYTSAGESIQFKTETV